ncbi:cupin domain-containing protein [bacterium]|nr:cupin domain-containing protein [bacterium]
MTNYSITELGKLNDLGKNFENGKAFLHDVLNLTSCEISINSVPVGFKVPFNHKHKENEEIYIVLKGKGVLTVDEKDIKLKEGTSVRVATFASRTLANTGDDIFQFICVQAKENSLTQYVATDGVLC